MIQRTLTISLAVLFILTALTPAYCSSAVVSNNQVSIITSSSSSIEIEFTSEELDAEQFIVRNETVENNINSGIGVTNESDKPGLPLVSRFVIVPPDVGLELVVESVNQRRVRSDILPQEHHLLNGIYPPVVAEMSEPTIVRGVRIVKVTTYPVQYDPNTEEYIHNENIQASIHFTNETPVNPVNQPFSTRRNQSREFLKYINALTLNDEDILRDNNGTISPYAGHYLIVTNSSLLNAARDFIEWRRKAGYKVDILSLTNAESRNSATVKREIQEVYDSCLDEGFDPFDNLLLIGDIDYGRSGPRTETLLGSPSGETGWRGDHADYKYALLEGDDLHMETAVARWCAGNDDLVGLFTGRLLAYEAEPDMDDRDWFTRGSVGSYHWGNRDGSAWYVSIHTNVRYGLQALDRFGMQDIRFYEDYEWDRNGDNYDPWITDQYNEGVNIILSRAECYNFRENFNGIDYNNKFPVMVNYSGHGEFASWNQTRSGTADRLRGPASITLAWGDPTTLSMNTVWLNNVQGLLVEDLSFGWSWVYGVTNIEKFIPDHQIDPPRGQRQWFYPMIKTDTDVYGDPGLQVWRGVPIVTEVDHVEVITPETKSLKVLVFDTFNGEVPVNNARVSLYVPGELPNEADEYAEHEVFQATAFTDPEGEVRFVFNDAAFDSGVMYITVTGREIMPEFSEIQIEPHAEAIELIDYSIIETVGNEDEDINPGETFLLSLTGINRSEETDREDVTASVVSLTSWIEIEENEYFFGNIPAGEIVECDQVVPIEIHQSCPDGETNAEKPRLSVQFRSRNRVWRSVVELNSVSPDFRIVDFPDGEIISTEVQGMDIEVENFGRLDSGILNARIEPIDIGINIIRSEATFPGLESGESGRIEGDPFRLAGHELTIPGSMQEMRLILTDENGFTDTVEFNLQVGEPRRNAPQGPDGYGYVCLDDSDVNWDIAPMYDWIEINPEHDDRDFDGRLCNYEGRSEYDVGEAEIVNMGMSFQFYGEMYNTITIFSNGYIVPGDHPEAMNFQNFPMEEGLGGGKGMIAPFWDWLDIRNVSGVFYFHDNENGRFIVQYDRLRHHSGGGEDLTFEVILYDHEIWRTPSGDQDILFQYKTISQTRGEQVEAEWSTNVPYASVGISSFDGTTGLGYTFNNEYPVTSEPLTNRQAILFTTALFPAGPVPPSNFSLMFPSNGALLASTLIEFNWERSIDENPGENVTYEFIIETQEQFIHIETEDNSLQVNVRELEIPLEVFINEGAIWYVIAYGGEDAVESNERFLFNLSPTVDISNKSDVSPLSFGISAIHPNPVNGPATVLFGTIKSGQVNLSIYDLKGRLTEKLISENLSAGAHTTTWQTDRIPTGLYLLKLEAGERVHVEKVAVVK